MSNNLPVPLSSTMPVNAVVDYSGKISQTELGTLDSYAARMHYKPHVVVLPPSAKTQNTQDLALQIAKTWNLEPNGFLLVVNPGSDTAAMVAGSSLQTKGINGKYITNHLMPSRFEKEYANGNLYGAIHITMGGVEHKLNVAAIASKANYVSHSNAPTFPIGMIFPAFFTVFILFALFGSRSSSSTRRLQLDNRPYERQSDLAADLARIHEVLGTGPVKQVPMKEFAQRASSSVSNQNSTQNRLESLSVHNASSRQNTSYGSEMLAEDAIAEKKIIASEKSVPLKLIFEGAHAGEKLAAPEPDTKQEANLDTKQETNLETNLEMPTFKPYEFPEDETVVPAVSSVQAPNDIAVPVLADSEQTTESVLKVDQYAAVMKDEPPPLASEPTPWQPSTYTMPAPPVMPEAPAMPVSQFASSSHNDFSGGLGASNYEFGSVGATPPLAATNSSNGSNSAPDVCPQCQSEKSPDFSFCLRCGHMFV